MVGRDRCVALPYFDIGDKASTAGVDTERFAIAQWHTTPYGMVAIVGRLDRDAWYEVAARVLVDQGGFGLRVESLCRAAGVTKGSFYHHFRDLSEFTAGFVEYLYRRGAKNPLSELPAISSPHERLRRLIEAIANEDLALEAAIRRWAASDRGVADHVRRVDAAGAAFLTDLYGELIPRDAELAGDLSRLARAFYLGAVMLDPPITGDEYRRLAGLLDRIVGGLTCRT